MRRLTGFKKGDPKAVTKVEKVLRIHLKDRGNGISAESALLEKGFKGAHSNAPYTVDIPIEDNLDKINEIISKPKVGSMELKNGETVHSMDITPTMRKSIMEEGQPIGAVGSKTSTNNSAGVLPMLGLTGATAGAIGAGGVALENALHKKDEHGQSFADILKGIFDNMQGGK